MNPNNITEIPQAQRQATPVEVLKHRLSQLEFKAKVLNEHIEETKALINKAELDPTFHEFLTRLATYQIQGQQLG